MGLTLLLGILAVNGYSYENNQSASIVLGQSNMMTNGFGVSTSSFHNPVTPYIYNNKLFFLDLLNNRVLIYNNFPTINNQAADVVVGQPDFASSQINQGGGPNANTLYTPEDVWAGNNKLIVADFRNNRVLIYNAIPTSNNAAADVVIGQSDMTSSLANQGGPVSAHTLNWPKAVWSDGTKLFISDGENHRVLIYHTIPTSNNAAADVVIGQPDMSASNQGCTATLMKSPGDIRGYNGKLFIADAANNRILVYNSIPNSNNAAADYVIGQASFTANSINQGLSNCASHTLYNPERLFIYNDRLMVSDMYNHRVLIYDPVPTSGNPSANTVIGQPNMISNSDNQGGSVSAQTLASPRGVVEYNQKLVVTDYSNHRVLIYEDEAAPIITTTSTATPTAESHGTPTVTPTISATETPISDFEGRMISEKYTYTAPNPARGDYANFTIHVREACELKVKVYTTSNRYVMGFGLNCSAPGKYQKRVYMGNLANGVYLFLVKAKNSYGNHEKLIKKIGLIK